MKKLVTSEVFGARVIDVGENLNDHIGCAALARPRSYRQMMRSPVSIDPSSERSRIENSIRQSLFVLSYWQYKLRRYGGSSTNVATFRKTFHVKGRLIRSLARCVFIENSALKCLLMHNIIEARMQIAVRRLRRSTKKEVLGIADRIEETLAESPAVNVIGVFRRDLLIRFCRVAIRIHKKDRPEHHACAIEGL